MAVTAAMEVGSLVTPWGFLNQSATSTSIVRARNDKNPWISRLTHGLIVISGGQQGLLGFDMSGLGQP